VNNNNIYDIEVSEKLMAEDCTEEFFMIEKFCNNYAIVRVKNEFYAIVDKEAKKCIIRFKTIVPVQAGVYMLHLEEDKHILFCINKNEEIVFSEKFNEIIKAFKDFLLIEPLAGARRLVCVSEYVESFKFEEWPEGLPLSGAKDHAIMTPILSDNKVILLKDGLVYSDFEFSHVESQFTGNSYRIVHLGKDNKRCVIKIPSFERSESYANIRMFGSCMCKNEYLYVNDKKHQGTALMRISDFEVSPFFESVLPIADNFALVKETAEGPETILRLSDFKIAKFD